MVDVSLLKLQQAQLPQQHQKSQEDLRQKQPHQLQLDHLLLQQMKGKYGQACLVCKI